MNRTVLFFTVFLILVFTEPGIITGQNSVSADKQKKPINIGLLISVKENRAAVDAALLAIDIANKAGGFSGEKLNLVTRSVEGLWGAGSIQSVGLIFDDNVVAILGSLDGRNAHLAEQVTAKTHVAFISSRATDMSLSGAFVPWFFRAVPNDRQQAEKLFEEIYKKRKLKNVAILRTTDYDSEHSAQCFIKDVKADNFPAAKEFIINPGRTDSSVLKEIENASPEALVLFCNYKTTHQISPLIKHLNNTVIFSSLSALDNHLAETTDMNLADSCIIITSNQWFTKKGASFQKDFQKKYGYQPGPVAAYAFDGMNIIIESIKKAGTDRVDIIDAIKQSSFSGTTGSFSFDKLGNRTDKASLMLLKNGVPEYRIK